MKPNDTKLLAALVFFALAMLCVLGAFAGCEPRRVAAQDVVSALTPPIALARTGVRESGLRAYRRDDTAAIHAVISFRGEHIYGTNYLEALLRATQRAPLRLDAPHPWIVNLMPGGGRPALWPGHLRWRSEPGLPGNDQHWRRTYRHSRDVLRGDIEHRCRMPGSGVDDVPAVPHAWGNFYDARTFRRDNPSAIDLDCGQTCTLNRNGSVRLDRNGNPKCNYFLHLPRYGARFGDV